MDKKENFLKIVEMLVAVAFGIAYWLYDLQTAKINAANKTPSLTIYPYF